MDCANGTTQGGLKTANVFVRIRPENAQEKKYKTVGNEKHLADYSNKSLTVYKVRVPLN